MKTTGINDIRALTWKDDSGALQIIDQRQLPSSLEMINLQDEHQVAEAICSMAVRGAPAIGVAAAFGLALAARRSIANHSSDLRGSLALAAEELLATRPTAINLQWAVKRMLKRVDQPDLTVTQIKNILLEEACHIADEDVQTNLRIASLGAALIDDGDTVIHHCNTGALATVAWGTALGVIRKAHQLGKRVHVLVGETRPRLQGGRLTAWELQQYGIPFEVISDNAAGHFLHTGKVQKVLFGADRMAANGDVANKIGTYMLALAAYENNVPVYCVLPMTTIDLSLADGSLIPIEERDPQEVLDLQVRGRAVFPSDTRARNPAFDVTPHHLLTAIVTDREIIYPPFAQNINRLFYKNCYNSKEEKL